MNALLIKTDGTKVAIEPKNGAKFTLKECYQLIGCEMIEVVRAWEDDMIIICDEEGRLNGKHFNFDASIESFSTHIVGDAIYCHISMLE